MKKITVCEPVDELAVSWNEDYVFIESGEETVQVEPQFVDLLCKALMKAKEASLKGTASYD